MLLKNNALIYCILLICPFCSSAQLSVQQERNLIAFAKIYGYVQYFHPSDEAKYTIWDNLAINGTNLVLETKDDGELIEKLRFIFMPIAPTLKIFSSNEHLTLDTKALIPEDLNHFKEIFWQHLGFNLYCSPEIKSYYSIKLNRTSPFKQIGEYTSPLSGNYDVSRFAGMEYDFTINIRQLDTLSGQKLKISLSENTRKKGTETTIDEKERLYHFKGVIGDSTQLLSFDFQGNSGIPIAVDVISFKIKADQEIELKPTNSDISSVPLRFRERPKVELKSGDLPLFKEHLRFGDHLDQEIVPGIKILMPMVLYGNEQHTYPIPDSISLEQSADFLRTKNKEYYSRLTGFNYKELRLADVIILWNILRHSFPYWEDVKEKPEKILSYALQMASKPQTAKQFFNTVKRMCSFYNDSHMFVFIDKLEDKTFTLPVSLIEIDKKVYIKDCFENTPHNSLLPGDIIQKINGVDVRIKLDSIRQYHSGSDQMKELLALPILIQGEKGSSLTLTIKRGNLTKKVLAQVNASSRYLIPGNSGYLERKSGWLDTSTYYFDLTRNTLDNNSFNILKKAKSIIFDLRGYVFDQSISVDLIPALLNKPILSERMFVPKILRPDYKKITYDGWKESIGPNNANHLNGNIYFLTDGSAQSASESILGLVKDFHLGTIVGTPTSGTNGDVNFVILPGNLMVYFSGTKVTNSDGSKHHLRGIIPDVYATQSQESLVQQKDLVLEKAMQLIRKE